MPICSVCGASLDAPKVGVRLRVPQDYFLKGWAFYDNDDKLHFKYENEVVFKRIHTTDSEGFAWIPYVGVCPSCIGDNVILRRGE